MDDQEIRTKIQALGERFGSELSELTEKYFTAGLPLNSAAKILMAGALDCHETHTGTLMCKMLEEFGKHIIQQVRPPNAPQ